MAPCHNCGAKTLPGQRVCKACGEFLERASEPPEGPDPNIGRVIGDGYEILEAIGEGAMGRVYKAHQMSLDKTVAIKVLHRHLANDPKIARRFHREARAASRLSHPNSLRIIDFGEDSDGTLYIAMEFLDGDDLLTLIEQDAPLSPARILFLMRQVLRALESAHAAGIIHRDLKPENIVVLQHGGQEHVIVCDFGIAKIPEAEGGSALTVSGFVCGTPEFMAPEQARGEELDKRADIYAAGCVLYQMLTGLLPFVAESALGIITKHLTEEPIPPRTRKPEWNIPAALEHVCLEAMRKARGDRYPDAAAMSEALESAVERLGEAATERLGTVEGDPTAEIEVVRPEAPATRRWSPWAPLALLSAGVVAFVTFVSFGSDGAGTLAIRPHDDAEVAAQDAGGVATTADAGLAPATDGGLARPDAAPDTATADAGRRSADHDRRTPREGSHGGTGAPPEAPPETPDQPSPGQQAYEQGRQQFLARDVRGAIVSFEEAARLMPTNAQVYKQLGRANMRAGNVAQAVESYRRYLELAPNAADRTIVERIIQREGR